MIRIGSIHGRVRFALCASTAALLLAGCVTYSPAQLSAMSPVDLCETLDVQSYNLSPESRTAIQGELQRRNENCSSHATVVAQRRRDFLDREMYGKESP